MKKVNESKKGSGRVMVLVSAIACVLAVIAIALSVVTTTKQREMMAKYPALPNVDSDMSYIEHDGRIGDLADDPVADGCIAKPDTTADVNIDTESSDIMTDVRMRFTEKAGWSKHCIARSGEVLHCMVEYCNTGSTIQNNVAVDISLPLGVKYVGDIVLFNAMNEKGVTIVTDAASTGASGYVHMIGNYAPGANALIKFDVVVDENATASDGSYVFATSSVDGEHATDAALLEIQ